MKKLLSLMAFALVLILAAGSDLTASVSKGDEPLAETETVDWNGFAADMARKGFFPTEAAEALPDLRIEAKTIDKTGALVIPHQYDQVSGFKDGLAAVFSGGKAFTGKAGFINTRGDVVAPFVYDNVHSFNEGFAGVQKDVKLEYIDLYGKVVVPPVFEWAWDFNKGLTFVKKDDVYGLLDAAGFKPYEPVSFNLADAPDTEGNQQIVFTMNENVTNFRFYEVDINHGGESGLGFALYEGKSLYSFDELTQGETFTVAWMGQGLLPHRGIAYTDTRGVPRWFYVSQSGEDGSPQLSPFDNPKVPETNLDEFSVRHTDDGVIIQVQTYIHAVEEEIPFDVNYPNGRPALFVNGSLYKFPDILETSGEYLINIGNIAGPLGAELEWNNETKELTITEGTARVTLPYYYTPGLYMADVQAYVDFEFIRDVFGCEVFTYDGGGVLNGDGTGMPNSYYIPHMPQIMIGRYSARAMTNSEAVEHLRTQLAVAFRLRFNKPFVPLEDAPVEWNEEEGLRHAITNMSIMSENDRFYIIHMIWDFFVDKYTGKVYLLYNGLNPRFTEFDPEAPGALAFAG